MIPFFSIVTPVYNGVSFFPDLKRQVISQTFLDWEWIIVDDHSQDGSYELFKSLESDSRIFVSKRDPLISKIKQGPYAARNQGLGIASGHYIVFLDADDIWSANKLASDYRSIQDNCNPHILYSPSYVFISGSNKLPVLRPFTRLLPPKLAIRFLNPFPMLSTTVRKTSIGAVSFRPMNHEDYIFWFEILRSNPDIRVAFCPRVNTFYRYSINSLSGNKLKVLSWWIDCYKFMGYNQFVSIVFLFLRTMIYFTEVLFMKTNFVERCPLPGLSCND